MGVHNVFSEQVVPSIINDSRSGLSNLAFRTAPPIGGLLVQLLVIYLGVGLMYISYFASIL